MKYQPEPLKKRVKKRTLEFFGYTTFDDRTGKPRRRLRENQREAFIKGRYERYDPKTDSYK